MFILYSLLRVDLGKQIMIKVEFEFTTINEKKKMISPH